MTKRKDLFWWLAILVVLGSGAYVVVASEASPRQPQQQRSAAGPLYAGAVEQHPCRCPSAPLRPGFLFPAALDWVVSPCKAQGCPC